MIPFLDLRLSMREVRPEIDRAIARVLDSGNYILGQEVEAFENEFASYCGAHHCVGVASGLDALTLLLRAHGIGVGDEVIVPSNTYIATWLAVSAVGARVVPVEPSLATYNLDPARVEESVGSRTRAILAVHLYGQSAEMEALGKVAQRHGLALLADAAQAHGVDLGGCSSAFSFYPTKNLGAFGDGGAVVTADGALAERIRVLRNYGSRVPGRNEVRGINSRLDSLQAAVLRVKLKFLNQWNRRRAQIALLYQNQLNGIPGLVLPRVAPGRQSVWHVFPVRHPQRTWLEQRLAHEGIATLIHYPLPPHLSEAFSDLGFRRGSLPLAERIAAEELSLPLHPHLTPEQVEEIIASVCLAA